MIMSRVQYSLTIGLGVVSLMLLWFSFSMMQSRNTLQEEYITAAHQVKLLSLQRSRDSVCLRLTGSFLSAVLGISETLYANIRQKHALYQPILVMIVKSIDCHSCYNSETMYIRQMQQQGIDVPLIAYDEAEYIERDFANNLVLFPPPFARQFLQNFPFPMAVLYVLPSGLIIRCHIPDSKNHSISQRFYAEIAEYYSYALVKP
jgi:hypothetical protein